MGDNFVRHVRCLLTTGSSAQSCREQLLLSGQYFLAEKHRGVFLQDVPQVRWLCANHILAPSNYHPLLYTKLVIYVYKVLMREDMVRYLLV